MSKKTKIVLAVAVGFLGSCLGLCTILGLIANATKKPNPAGDAFEEANRKIGVYERTSAFGNTPEAEKLASSFSAELKKGLEKGFTGGKRGAISFTKGEVLVYCRKNANSTVFLLHVPEYRQYKDEVRTVLSMLTWAVAQDIVKEAKVPDGTELAVGTRGAMLYGAVMIGKVGEEPGDTFFEDANSVSRDALVRFFDPQHTRASAASQPNTPATAPVAPPGGTSSPIETP